MTLERNGDEEVHLDRSFSRNFLPELSWPGRLAWSRRGWPVALSTAESSARPTINRPGSFKGQFSSNLGSIGNIPHLFLGFGEFYVTVNFRSPGEIHQILVQTFIFNFWTFSPSSWKEENLTVRLFHGRIGLVSSILETRSITLAKWLILHRFWSRHLGILHRKKNCRFEFGNLGCEIVIIFIDITAVVTCMENDFTSDTPSLTSIRLPRVQG